MGDDTRDNRNARTVLLEIARLGFEVGYLGHLEGIGWVSKRLKDLETRASTYEVLDQAREKYNLAKDLGKKRRLQNTSSSAVPEIHPQKPLIASQKDIEKLPTTLRISSEGQDRFKGLLRVQPADGILALANLLKVAENSHWVTRQLDIAFSGIADLHDQLSGLNEDGSPESILEEGLDRLKRSGWISDFKIDEINHHSKTIKISAISMIPSQYGTGTEPVCKNISLALESIGLRAFKTPMHAFERKCICQGEDKCGFIILPRATDEEEKE
ncbi:MAG: hypothetical protein OEV21_00925 [Thermoplasmata archaeon]|nr:hypothetical protein [Thermoplasmata archaeon]